MGPAIPLVKTVYEGDYEEGAVQVPWANRHIGSTRKRTYPAIWRPSRLGRFLDYAA